MEMSITMEPTNPADSSIFIENMCNRSVSYKRNEDLDQLLKELECLLNPVESVIEAVFNSPTLPPLFVVGNPRSGTTLFMQFLAGTGGFAVPSNLLSRFYYAPYIGAKIQQLLTDCRFDYKNELIDLKMTADYSSNLGKTVGILAPSEFYHFWRRFLPNYDPEYLTETRCKLVDRNGLQKGVAAIEHVFAKPFATKAVIIQYNLEMLNEIFSNSLILFLERCHIFIMQSILLARESFYENRNIWWSVKPKEYEMLKNMDIYHQIAGQVYYTEKSIKSSFCNIPEQNTIVVKYDELCNDPSSVYSKLMAKYHTLGVELDGKYTGPSSFNSSDQIRISRSELLQLEKAYEYFENSHQ